ncbi:family 1 glycosylhydrolase, partial [Lactococcus lactis]
KKNRRNGTLFGFSMSTEIKVLMGITKIADDLRISYHQKHLEAMKKAIFTDGVEVMGYLGWGLIDIPASSGAIDKRYGAVYVDSKSHKRIPKKSFHWFKNVFASNGDHLD